MPVDTTTPTTVSSFADRKCPHCQKVFPKRPWLDHHKRTCLQKNQQNTAATGSHSTSKSSVIQFYACSKCPLICKSYIGYRHHMIKKHQEVLSRYVDDCAIKSVKASRQQADATSRLTPSVEAPKSDTAGQHKERAPSDTIVQRVDPSTSFNVSKSKAGPLLEAERNKVLLKQVSPSRCLDFSKSKITRSPQGGAKSPKKRVSCPFCYKSNHKYKSLWHLERHMSTKHKRTVPSPSLTHDHLYCAPSAGMQTSKLTGKKTPSLSTIDKLEGGTSAGVASVPETSVSPNASSQSTLENETVGLPPLQPCIQTSTSSVSGKSEDDASSPLQQIATLSLEMTPVTSVLANISSRSTLENDAALLPSLQPCIQTSPSSVSGKSEGDASSPLQQIATLSLEMTPVTSVSPNISSQSTLENDAALLPPLQPCIQPSPHRSTSSVSATSQDFVSPPYRPISTPSCKTTPASDSSADPATALKCPLCIDGSNVFNDSHELSVHCLSMHSPQVLLKNCRPEDAKQACSPKSLKLYLWKCAKCCEDGHDKIFRSYEDFNKHISCHHGKVHSESATSQSHVGEVFKAGMTQPPCELKGVSTNGHSTFQVRVSLAKDEESDGDKVPADVLPERKQNAKSVTDHHDDDTVPFKSAIAPFLAAVRSELSSMSDTHSKSDSVQDNRQQRCHPTKVSHEKSVSRPQVAIRKMKAKARVKECISKHLELSKYLSDHHYQQRRQPHSMNIVQNSVNLPESLLNSRMDKATHPSRVGADVQSRGNHDNGMFNRDAKAAVPFKSAIAPFLATVRSELSSMSDVHSESDSAQEVTHSSLDRATSTNVVANERMAAVTEDQLQASMSDSAVGSELSSLSDFQSETESSQDDSQERSTGVVKHKLEEFVEAKVEKSNGDKDAADVVLQSLHAIPMSHHDDDADTIPYMSDVRSELSSLSDFQSETESTQDDSQEKSQWADRVVKNRMEKGAEDEVDTFESHQMVDGAKTKQRGDDSSLKKTKEVLKKDNYHYRFKRDSHEVDEKGDGEKSGINEFGSGETEERPPVLDVMMRMLADIGGIDGCDYIEKLLDVLDMEVLPVGENVEVEGDVSGREKLVSLSAGLENDQFISDDGSDMEQGSDSEMETEEASGNTNVAAYLESCIKNKTNVNRSDVLQVSEATDPTNGEKDSENVTAEDAKVNKPTDDLQSAEAPDLSKDQFLCYDMEQDFNKEMAKSESLPVVVQSGEAPDLINDLFVTENGIVERAYGNIMEATSTEKPKSDRSSSETNVVEDADNGINEGGEMKRSESLADLGQLQALHMMNDLFLSDGSLRQIPDGINIDQASDMPRNGTSPSQTSIAEELENVTEEDKQVKSSQIEDFVDDASASQHIVDSKTEEEAHVMPQNKVCEENPSTMASQVDPTKDGSSSCSAKENKNSTMNTSKNTSDSVNMLVNTTSQSIDSPKLSNGNQTPCTPPKGQKRATHYTFQENSFKDQLAMIQESPMSSGFKCRICKLKFTKDVLPLVHMRSHVQKHNYQCSLCKFKSSFKSAMLRHLQSMHKISRPQGVKKMAVFSGRVEGEEETCGFGVTKRSLCKEEDESGKTKQQKISNLDRSPSSSAGSWCDREKALLKSISSDDSVDSIIREEEVCGSDLTKCKLGEDENRKRKQQKISNLEGSPSSSAESWCDREKALLKSISSDDCVDFAKFTPLTDSRPAKSKRKDHTPKRVDVNLEMVDWKEEDEDVRFESCRRRLCSDDEDDADSDLVMDICDPTNEQGVEGSRTLEPSGDKNQEDRINVPGSTSTTHPRTPREGSSSERVVEESRTVEPSGGKNHEDGINFPGGASRTHAGIPREDLLLEQVTFQGMPEEHCRAGDGRVSQSQESNMETINSTMPSKELPTRTPRFGDIIVGLCIQTHLCAFMPSIEAQKILLEVCDPRLRLPRRCDKPACWEKRTTYRSFQTLFQHVLNHVGETPYCCKTCNYQTRSLTFLNNHMKAVHKCDPLSNAWELPSIDYLNGLPSKWYPVQGNNNGIQTSPGGERPIEQTNIAERLVCDDPETARHRKKFVQKVDYIYSPSIAEKSLYSSMKSLFPSANPDVMQILCRFCRKPYSIRDIFLHQRRDHDKMKPFTCCQCEFTCDILADMIAHVKTHQTLGASDVFHICNWQDRRYHQIYTKPSHSSLTDSQVYHCNACKYTSFKLPEMHQHVLANHRVILGLERDPMNGQYLCYVCKQLWADQKAAVKHKCKMVLIVIEQRSNQRLTTSVEKRPSDLTCKLCVFIATTAAALRVHNIVVHEQAQPSSHQLPSAHVDQLIMEDGQVCSTSQPRQVQSSDGQVVPVRIQKTPSDNEGMTSWPAVYQLNQLQEQARQDSADRLQSPDGIHSSSPQSQNGFVTNNHVEPQSVRMESDQQSSDNLAARPRNNLPSDINNEVVQSYGGSQVQPARRSELADLLFSPSPTASPPNQTSHQQVRIGQPALNQPNVSPGATQSLNSQWPQNSGYVQTSRQGNSRQRSASEDGPSSGQQGHPAVAHLGYVGQLSQSNAVESERQVPSNNMVYQPWNGLPPQNRGAPITLQYPNGRWVRGRSLSTPHEDMQWFPSWIGPQSPNNSTDQASQSQNGGMQSTYRSPYPQGQAASGYQPFNMNLNTFAPARYHPYMMSPRYHLPRRPPTTMQQVQRQVHPYMTGLNPSNSRVRGSYPNVHVNSGANRHLYADQRPQQPQTFQPETPDQQVNSGQRCQHPQTFQPETTDQQVNSGQRCQHPQTFQPETPDQQVNSGQRCQHPQTFQPETPDQQVNSGQRCQHPQTFQPETPDQQVNSGQRCQHPQTFQPETPDQQVNSGQRCQHPQTFQPETTDQQVNSGQRCQHPQTFQPETPDQQVNSGQRCQHPQTFQPETPDQQVNSGQRCQHPQTFQPETPDQQVNSGQRCQHPQTFQPETTDQQVNSGQRCQHPQTFQPETPDQQVNSGQRCQQPQTFQPETPDQQVNSGQRCQHPQTFQPETPDQQVNSGQRCQHPQTFQPETTDQQVNSGQRCQHPQTFQPETPDQQVNSGQRCQHPQTFQPETTDQQVNSGQRCQHPQTFQPETPDQQVNSGQRCQHPQTFQPETPDQQVNSGQRCQHPQTFQPETPDQQVNSGQRCQHPQTFQPETPDQQVNSGQRCQHPQTFQPETTDQQVNSGQRCQHPQTFQPETPDQQVNSGQRCQHPQTFQPETPDQQVNSGQRCQHPQTFQPETPDQQVNSSQRCQHPQTFQPETPEQQVNSGQRCQHPQTFQPETPDQQVNSGQRCQHPQTFQQSKTGQQVNSGANQRLCPDQRQRQPQTLQHSKPDQQVNSAANQHPSANKRLHQPHTFQQEKLDQETNSGAKQRLCPDQRNQQSQTLQQDQAARSHYLPPPDYWTVARRPGGQYVAVPSGSSGRPVQGTRIPANLQRFMNPSAPTPPPPMSSTQMENILNNSLRTAAQRLQGGMKQTMVTDPKSTPLMEENPSTLASSESACHVENRQETLPVPPESTRLQTSPAQVSSAAVINSETVCKDLPGEEKTDNSETARKDLSGEVKCGESRSDININVPDLSDEDFLEWMLHSPIPDEPSVNLPEEPDTDKDSSPTLSLNTVTSHSEDIPVLNDKDSRDQGASAAAATMPSMEEWMASRENTSSGKPDSDNDEQVQSESTPMVTRVVNMKNGYMKKVGFGRPC